MDQILYFFTPYSYLPENYCIIPYEIYSLFFVSSLQNQEKNQVKDFQATEETNQTIEKESDIKQSLEVIQQKSKSFNHLQNNLLNQQSILQIDDEYNPSLDFKSGSGKHLQNQRRNVMPNLIHQILNFLVRQNKSGSIVRKLLKRFGNNRTTVKRCYFFQKLLKKQINRYVNLKTLLKMVKPFEFIEKSLMSQNQQQIYCSITRRLITHFLRNQAACVTIYSSKIKKQNRIFHLQAQRRIVQSFKEEKLAINQ